MIAKLRSLLRKEACLEECFWCGLGDNPVKHLGVKDLPNKRVRTH